jgi:transposase
VAGIAVRNPQMLAFARHYSLTVCTCEPADPASKGGSESTVKIAKADLVGEGDEPARRLRLVRGVGGGV